MSLLAMQIERECAKTTVPWRALIEAMVRVDNLTLTRKDAFLKYRALIRGARSSNTLRILRSEDKHRLRLQATMAFWALNPADKTEEMGLNIERFDIQVIRERARVHRIAVPCCGMFMSVHAINRIHERSPRTTMQNVMDLGFDFAKLAGCLSLDPETHVAPQPKGSGTLPVPGGQQYARANLMATAPVDPRMSIPGTVDIWLDVRTVVPAGDQRVVAHARACAAAVKNPKTPIPFLPRREDSYTLGIVQGRSVN